MANSKIPLGTQPGDHGKLTSQIETNNITRVCSSIYIKLPRRSVCVSVFWISQKRVDRFQWNCSSIIGGRRERIKRYGKFRPSMCKNSENGAKLPTSRKYPRATHAGVRNGLRFQFASSPARWPVVRQRHGPIACGPGGVARSVQCGTVSNAFVLLSPV